MQGNWLRGRISVVKGSDGFPFAKGWWPEWGRAAAPPAQIETGEFPVLAGTEFPEKLEVMGPREFDISGDQIRFQEFFDRLLTMKTNGIRDDLLSVEADLVFGDLQVSSRLDEPAFQILILHKRTPSRSAERTTCPILSR